MAQVQVNSPLGGLEVVYAGKSPDTDTNPWPAAMQLAAHDTAALTAAVVALGAPYTAAYVQPLNKNDMIFALRVASIGVAPF